MKTVCVHVSLQPMLTLTLRLPHLLLRCLDQETRDKYPV